MACPGLTWPQVARGPRGNRQSLYHVREHGKSWRFLNLPGPQLWPSRNTAVILFPISDVTFVICYNYIMKTMLSKYPYKGITWSPYQAFQTREATKMRPVTFFKSPKNVLISMQILDFLQQCKVSTFPLETLLLNYPTFLWVFHYDYNLHVGL